MKRLLLSLILLPSLAFGQAIDTLPALADPVDADSFVVLDASANTGKLLSLSVLKSTIFASPTFTGTADFDAVTGASLTISGAFTFSSALSFPDNVRQTLNPGATNAGLNVGSLAGDPSAPTNGDLWYDSTAGELTARIAGANVALGAASGGSAPRVVGATWDGAGAAIATGQATGYFTVPYAGTISGWSISADTGTATVKVWKVANGTAVPTVANDINTTGVSLSTGTHVRSTTVTDFTTTTVTAGDVIAFNLTAVSGATKLTVTLEITP